MFTKVYVRTVFLCEIHPATSYLMMYENMGIGQMSVQWNVSWHVAMVKKTSDIYPASCI